MKTEWTCHKCGETLEYEVYYSNSDEFITKIKLHHELCPQSSEIECSFCYSITNNPHFSINISPNETRVNQLCDLCYATIPSTFLSGYHSDDILELARINTSQINIILRKLDES